MAGIRVVRGPDWRGGDQDGGEGHCGTVVMADAGPGYVDVCWENGCMSRYRAGIEGAYDLRILDNGPAGVLHGDVMCGICCETVRGLRWKCADCANFDLCTSCYSKDRHRLSHHFVRISGPGLDGIPVGTREGSIKIQLGSKNSGQTVKKAENLFVDFIDNFKGFSGIARTLQTLGADMTPTRRMVYYRDHLPVLHVWPSLPPPSGSSSVPKTHTSGTQREVAKLIVPPPRKKQSVQRTATSGIRREVTKPMVPPRPKIPCKPKRATTVNDGDVREKLNLTQQTKRENSAMKEVHTKSKDVNTITEQMSEVISAMKEQLHTKSDDISTIKGQCKTKSKDVNTINEHTLSKDIGATKEQLHTRNEDLQPKSKDAKSNTGNIQNEIMNVNTLEREQQAHTHDVDTLQADQSIEKKETNIIDGESQKDVNTVRRESQIEKKDDNGLEAEVKMKDGDTVKTDSPADDKDGATITGEPNHAKKRTSRMSMTPYTCPVCLDNGINVVYNCGHGTCEECSKSMNSCPMCRQTIVLRTKMFV